MPSGASPDPWTAFQTDCRNLQRAYLVGIAAGPGKWFMGSPHYTSRGFQVRLRDDGRATFDYGWPPDLRLALDGEKLTVSHGPDTKPELPQDSSAIARDLVTECLSGFSNTRALRQDPSVELIDFVAPSSTSRSWYMLEFPGTWDDEDNLFVLLDNPSGRLEAILVRNQLAIVQVANWDASWSDDALDSPTPLVSSQRPLDWRGPMDELSVSKGLEKYRDTHRIPLSPE